MATRYWHWLLYQKQQQPPQDVYTIRGTAAQNNVEFVPSYDGDDYLEIPDGILNGSDYYEYYDNTGIDPSINPKDGKVYYFVDYDFNAYVYFYYNQSNNLVLEYLPPQYFNNTKIRFSVLYVTDGVVDSESVVEECTISNGNWSFTYPKNKKIKSFSYNEIIYSSEEEPPVALTTINFDDADDFSEMLSTDYMFYNLQFLTSVNMNNATFDNLESMSYMFYGCDNLSTVNMSNAVLSNVEYMEEMFSYIGYDKGFGRSDSLTINMDSASFDSLISMYGIFNSCQNTYSIGIPTVVAIVNAPNLSDNIENLKLRFFKDSIYYSVDNTTDVIFFPKPTLYTGNVVIPASFTERNHTFYVKEIYLNAFRDCVNLTSVTIPEGIVIINSQAFSGCTGLTSVTIPSTVTNINYGAFEGCTNLTKATYTSISDLMEINFRDLRSNPLFCAKHLYIGNNEITNLNIIPSDATSIPDYVFVNCEYVTSITIPSTVTTIGKGAFYGCSAVQTVSIPSNVTNIKESAFENCTGLTSATIPSSVTTIGDSAFKNSSLTSVTIPSSVTTIGNNVFYNCDDITSVIVENTSLIVNGGYEYGKWGQVIAKDARLCFTKDGFMYKVMKYDEVALLKLVNKQTSGSVTIPTSVTAGGTYSVKKVCGNAFKNCVNITDVSYSGITEWGWFDNDNYCGSMFEGCTSLTALNPPIAHTNITDYSYIFKDCENIESISDVIDIDNSNKQINTGGFMQSFSGCTKLTGNITLSKMKSPSDGSQYVASYYNIVMDGMCEGSTLETFVWGGSQATTTSMHRAFKNCTDLTDVRLVFRTETYQQSNYVYCDNLFENCTSLEFVRFSYGSSVSSGGYYLEVGYIQGDDMFKNCTSLKEVDFIYLKFDKSLSFASSPLTMSSIRNVCSHLKKQSYVSPDRILTLCNNTTDETTGNVRALTSSEKDEIRDLCFNNSDSPKWDVIFV